MTKDIKATHVIIGGMVFLFADKAPYVSSGKSILGALEYNQEQDVVKCHVCGDWVKMIARHVRHDGITSAAYRTSHGFNARSPIYTPSVGEISRKRLAANTAISKDMRLKNLKSGHEKARITRLKGFRMNNRTGLSAELRNLRGLCFAQIRSRVLQLACKLGGTPTKIDLAAEGINPDTIIATYQMSVREFMKSLGLTPNGKPKGRGKYIREPLPADVRALASQLTQQPTNAEARA